jgi:hypothetical protein
MVEKATNRSRPSQRRRHPKGAANIVASTGDGAAYMEMGLDFESEAFSPEDRNTLLEWYKTDHGLDDLDLVSYMPFLIDHLPGHYKRMRQHVQATMTGRDGVNLPIMAYLLFAIHSYAAINFPKGLHYEILSAHHLGAPKGLVLDVLGYAYLSSGPPGITSAADMSDAFLRDWVDAPDLRPVKWPEGWGPNPAAFRAGIDYSTPDLTAEELQLISEWHQRMHGVVPRHVNLFGRLHPQALKQQRIRYERSIGNVMPAQMAPLLMLQLSTLRFQPDVMRQSIHEARVLGCRRHHVVQTIEAGLRQTAVHPLYLEQASDAIHDLLAGWED